MGDPRNPDRAHELWNQARLDVMLFEIGMFSDLITISGGWAWHFMSQPHEELKYFHDHKDIDVFVHPDKAAELYTALQQLGYKHITTIYDGAAKDPKHPAAALYRDFVRYEAVNELEGEQVKVTFDIFVGEIEGVELQVLDDSYPTMKVRVVQPAKLLSMYTLKAHQTDDCVAVCAARELVPKGIDIIGHEALTTPSPEVQALIDAAHKKERRS